MKEKSKVENSTPFLASALGATATLVSSKRCILQTYHILNTTAAVAYVQLFDALSVADVTPGTTVPALSLGIPASGGAVMAGGTVPTTSKRAWLSAPRPQ
jgi:hypothetical protein